jgi:hypothetical protein
MISRGGKPVAGFGVGDVLEEMEKSDPLYECHHDTYVKLKTFGTAILASAVTAGVIVYVVPWLRSEHLLPLRYHTGEK